jgi:hypothetical protein
MGYFRFFALSTFVFSSLSLAQVGLNDNEALDCTVTEMDSGLGSFFPPRVGDLIHFDLSDNEMTHLTFNRKNVHVPIVSSTDRLKKLANTNNDNSHIRFYIGEPESPGTAAQRKMQVVIIAAGNINDPLKNRKWTAKIQVLADGVESPWSLSEIQMACRLTH